MKPQDLVVLFYLATQPEGPWLLTYEALGASTGLSPSEAHKSLRRSQTAGLYLERRGVVRPALLEFTIHGLRYVFPAVQGPFTRGIPTGLAAPPLAGLLYVPEGGGFVWAHEHGAVRGSSIVPLYRTVPDAAPKHPDFYALLALADAVRAGRARERKVAADALAERLSASPL